MKRFKSTFNIVFALLMISSIVVNSSPLAFSNDFDNEVSSAHEDFFLDDDKTSHFDCEIPDSQNQSPFENKVENSEDECEDETNPFTGKQSIAYSKILHYTSDLESTKFKCASLKWDNFAALENPLYLQFHSWKNQLS